MEKSTKRLDILKIFLRKLLIRNNYQDLLFTNRNNWENRDPLEESLLFVYFYLKNKINKTNNLYFRLQWNLTGFPSLSLCSPNKTEKMQTTVANPVKRITNEAIYT